MTRVKKIWRQKIYPLKSPAGIEPHPPESLLRETNFLFERRRLLT